MVALASPGEDGEEELDDIELEGEGSWDEVDGGRGGPSPP